MQSKPIIGKKFRVRLPLSEVCCHMRVADKVATVELVGAESYPMAQIYIGGRPYSAPVLPGEAGIYHDGDEYYANPVQEVE